jgi:rare lipoprotein A
MGTMVRITNLQNGKSVIVKITDRGPAHLLHRVTDLSQAAAEQLDYTAIGTTIVLIQPLVYVETESYPIEQNIIENGFTSIIGTE